MNFVIIPAKESDIEEISQIHYDSFEDYFMNILGIEFLNLYYKNYLSRPEHVLLVAKNERIIIGFVAGTLRPHLLYQSLFKSHFYSIAMFAIKRLITSRKFRRQIIKRRHFITRAFRSKIATNKKRDIQDDTETAISEKCSSLLSIAVKEDYRGKGVSTRLIEAFERKIQRMGSLSCALSVRVENLRGIGFYKKTGWKISYKNKDIITFKKMISADSIEK